MRIIALTALTALSLVAFTACGTDTTQLSEDQANELVAKEKIWLAGVNRVNKQENKCANLDSASETGDCLGKVMDDLGTSVASLAPYLDQLSGELTGPCSEQIKASGGELEDFKKLAVSISKQLKAGDLQAAVSKLRSSQFNGSLDTAQKKFNKALDTCTSGS